MKRYPFEEKSLEELVKEANELLEKNKYLPEMTQEEEIEDDAEGGYFEDD